MKGLNNRQRVKNPRRRERYDAIKPPAPAPFPSTRGSRPRPRKPPSK